MIAQSVSTSLRGRPTGLRLDHLWIVPQAMHRGIGRQLFEHAVEEATRLGYSCIKIEADPNAEGFYKRMGAVRVGTRLSEVWGQRRELPLMEYCRASL
jgi:GNAT superfamily N-acetyltransferase